MSGHVGKLVKVKVMVKLLLHRTSSVDPLLMTMFTDWG